MHIKSFCKVPTPSIFPSISLQHCQNSHVMKFPHEFSSWSTHYYRHVEPKSIYPENNTKRPWQFPWKSGNMIYNPPTIIYIFSTLPTAAAPHRCLIFGQKWRSVELCRSDRIIRNEESKAGTTLLLLWSDARGVVREKSLVSRTLSPEYPYESTLSVETVISVKRITIMEMVWHVTTIWNMYLWILGCIYII